MVSKLLSLQLLPKELSLRSSSIHLCRYSANYSVDYFAKHGVCVLEDFDLHFYCKLKRPPAKAWLA